MGNIRRIKRSGQSHLPKIAMADAHVAVNGCQVFLGHPNPKHAMEVAKGFEKMLGVVIERSRRVNLGDMYKASMAMCEKVKNGEMV